MPKTFSRSWGQRSRSHSNDYGNLENSIAAEPPNVFEPKLTQMLTTVGRQTCHIFKVIGSEVRVRQ